MPVVVDIAALAAVLVAVVRIVTTDTGRWAHGRYSQAAWTLLVVWLIWNTRLGVLPIGAIAAIWKTHRLHHPAQRRQAAGNLDVPYADGIPVPFQRTATSDPSHDTSDPSDDPEVQP